MSVPPDAHQQRKQLGRARHDAAKVRDLLRLLRSGRAMLDRQGDMRRRLVGLRKIARLEAQLAALEREIEALSWSERVAG